MRVLFVGCVKQSEMFLQRLISDGVNVIGVITKSESKFNADFVDLGVLSREHGIDYIYVKNINSPESENYIMEKNPDIILCLGWSQLIKKEILVIPPKGCIGFHPAAIPHNRGRHPLIWALALGLEKTASSLFRMDENADSGDIVSQVPIDITYEDDATSLYEKVMNVALEQLSTLMKEYESDTVKYVKQTEAGNLWRKRSKCDGQIDWRMSSRGIYNLVRALTKPYVGSFFVHGDDEIRVWKSREIEDTKHPYANIEPGKVIKVYSNEHFVVKTGDNLIEVLECDPVVLVEGEYL
jgi:methionyl-tRNA formyltransferase